ncbi:MAG: protein phosphatase 2C domain-containing protein [Anaerolineales bacterium]|nr:protein phosphatase 2C domain-containing protein [Anaerolineales bacterium]MDW8277644.1 protein phosphatase 2C domain-containing protein [Anaerolineales bacterium]
MPAIEAHWATHIGRKRTNNEDAVGALEPRTRQEFRQNGALYVVADGLGGFQFGERASQYAVQTLLKEYPKFPQLPPGERLKMLIQRINADLYAIAQRELKEGEHMATTIVAAVVHQGRLQVAHVGDSRAYLIRGTEVYQLTADHSVIAELIRSGKLTEEEARGSKLRNRLTRSVGTRPRIEVELSQPIPLRAGDVILLCSDGLTQYASSEDLLSSVHGEPKEIVERLIAFANQQGGSDNISVITVRYGKPFTQGVSLPRWAQAGLITGLSSLLALLCTLVWWLSGASLPGWMAATSTFTPSLSPTWTVVLPTVTSTPSSTPTFSATPTATVPPTFTFTPEPTLTLSLSPSFTLIPTANSPTPAVSNTPEITFVTCAYIVKPKETAIQIAKRFGVPQKNITRASGNKNLNLIYAGETLFLHEVNSRVCIQEGGFIPYPASIDN